ncbi:MAG TPA: prepilin-type N-terminal cleavage/methylation domain-containing protein [Burkholderiaceae bacterium]|nr:prepilin-type N-terminal cleavage/methylation domain-containing protein [Burkholderiaceae bacterium]
MNTNLHVRWHSRGFTLIEALVALLVLSFGMLAIAGFQVTLTGSSDLAKQRTEATRLAQQKMESLRAFGQVDSDSGTPHKVNYTDDVVSSTTPETVTTNATYSRTWTVTPSASNTEKTINVQVAWTDRLGQPQSVQLLSVISKFDPQDIGTLATGPGGTSKRRPKNRNINIPYPAVTLSGGTQSAFTPPPGGITYVFDNASGNIVQSCTGLAALPAVPITAVTKLGSTVTVTAVGHKFRVNNQVTIAGVLNAAFNGGPFTVTAVNTSLGTFSYTSATPSVDTSSSGGTATIVAAGLSEGQNLATTVGVACEALDAYLLSGYVRFDAGTNPSGEEPSNPTNADYATLPLDPTSPFSLDTSNQSTTNGTPSMVCFSEQQKVVATSSISPVTITGWSFNSSTRVVTLTVASHDLLVGQRIAVNEASNSAFMGEFVVTAITGTTVSYVLPPPAPSNTTVTGGKVRRVERVVVSESTAVPYLTNYTDIKSRFVSYACIMTPVDHDNSLGTPKRWWGKVTLSPLSPTLSPSSGWTIGTANGNYKVCRYSADYTGDGALSNSEHPLWYRGVTGALDNQNYLVIREGSGQPRQCPTDRPPDYTSSPANFTDSTTAGHQPGSFADRSFVCPAAGCGSKVYREPNDSGSADIPME